MGIQEIPRSFKYTCDRCGADHVQQNAGGHYTDSRPPGWGRFTMNRDAFDHSGGIITGGGNFEILFCAECSSKVAESIGRIMSVAKQEELGV